MSDNDSKREIAGIVLFFCAVALMLIFYLLSPDTWGVKFIHDLCFGMVGKTAAFLIPISMLYGSIDFFVAKNSKVSKVRVRSVVIFVLLISALLAVCTSDFEYMRELCADAATGKYKATSAIKLLWNSGIDSALVTPLNSGKSVLTGGILGTGIALGMYTIMGKIISILFLVLLLLSQIIVVFKISLKSTAKHVVRRTTSTINNVRRSSSSSRPVGYSGTRPQGHNGSRPVQVRRSPNGRPQKPQAPAGTNYRQEFLQPQPNNGLYRRSAFEPNAKDGFANLSDKAFGVDGRVDKNSLAYGTTVVSTEGSQNAPVADYGFTATPKNAPLRARKEASVPSFLRKDEKQDFYDLGNAQYPAAVPAPQNSGAVNAVASGPAVQSYTDNYQADNYDAADDTPYELIDDEPYDYSVKEHPIRVPGAINVPEQNYDYSAQVPYPAAPAVTPAPAVPQAAPQAVPSNTVIEAQDNAAVREDITINAKESDNSGFSSTEGRIIETSKAPTPVPTLEIGTSKPVVDTHANNGKIISKRKGPYVRPNPAKLLAPETAKTNGNDDAALRAKALKLEEAIKSFGIDTKVINITHGPAITRFELTLATGVKVSRILNLQDDIALAMAAISVRIEAPIPGKSAIGIEIPNEKTSAVQLRGLIESKEFRAAPPLTVPLGRDIPGQPIMCNLAKMPHLLIAGSTGSGKSVCINTILTSILFNSSYDDVRMVLIDPKVVELSIYNGIPHLIMPVVTQPKKAAGALKWAVEEMERRYKLFAESSVRDLAGYNEYLKYNGEKPLPLILIVIDELADLMTVAAKEVEDHISRLAAMARAAGLHMIIATQRPSVDVITGVIKANVPSRIAFAVSSGVDSRTILDSVGAEKLLGKGDMLYAPLSAPKPIRGQGAFLSDKEVEGVVTDLKNRYGAFYDEDIIKAVDLASGAGGSSSGGSSGAGGDGGNDEDELLEKAVQTVIDAKNASVSILQRRLGIGYPRAARLIDILEQKHYIGPFEGSKPRKVLITETDWLEIKAKGNQ